MSESTTEEQAEEMVRGFSEARMTIPNFLNNVVLSDDTTKTGYLKDEELGYPKLPVRTYKELEVFCEEVLDEIVWASYFKQMAESTNSTSLSREGFLIKAAITTKKELADVTPVRKKNKGWFKSKSDDQPPQPIS